MTKVEQLPLLDGAGFEKATHDLGEHEPLTLALIDLDHFQEINGALGHEGGNRVLRFVEGLLTRSLPLGSVVGRVGGDEYAAALPGASAEEALIVFNEIGQHFAAVRDLAPGRLSLSVGLAQRPTHAASLPDLRRAADEALLRAKREGRGRIAIYTLSKMVLKSNYYPKSSLERLAKLSAAQNRTEASLLREALDNLVDKYRESL